MENIKDCGGVVMFDYNFDMKMQEYYDDIFMQVHDVMDDHEVLKLGIEFLKIAMARLDGDLNREDILKEYVYLGDIIKKLEEIDKNYV